MWQQNWLQDWIQRKRHWAQTLGQKEDNSRKNHRNIGVGIRHPHRVTKKRGKHMAAHSGAVHAMVVNAGLPRPVVYLLSSARVHVRDLVPGLS